MNPSILMFLNSYKLLRSFNTSLFFSLRSRLGLVLVLVLVLVLGLGLGLDTLWSW